MTQRLVEKTASLLETRTGRRGFLARAAVVGSALVTSPIRYVLHPLAADSCINCCSGTGCSGKLCCDGYTTFCCTINNGSNTCPSGTVVAGWWLCHSSTFCSGHARYYVDCNAQCNCSTGCSGSVHTDCGGSGSVSNPICSSACDNCSCHCANCSCGNRSTCKNRFRYGNCNTATYCVGRIVCRVVSCAPPYQWQNCNTSSCVDDNTCSHTSTCL